MKISNMVLIGATGRNTGKTTLACALIEHLRKRHRVIGVKVTSVDRAETAGHRVAARALAQGHAEQKRHHREAGGDDKLEEDWKVFLKHGRLKPRVCSAV